MSNANQFRVTAEYLKEQGLSPSFPSRFFSKVQITESCWIWHGAKNHKNGYGVLSKWHEGKLIYSHRASWLLHFGPIENGLHVLHNCPDGDRKDCVNPAHLYLGTEKQNSHDAWEKCQINNVGESHVLSKLTEDTVAEITELWDAGVSATQLSNIYGMSRDALWKAATGRRWKRVHAKLKSPYFSEDDPAPALFRVLGRIVQ